MEKIKFKKIHLRKGWWKSLLAAILCIGVIVGVGFGVASIFKPDKVDDFVTYTTLPVTKFRVGGLDGNGNYMNTDQSIYTKDAFECQGLNCTLDFDNEISYQVYFYDQNNEFVYTTGKLTGAFVQDSVPFFAKYARIVITPKDDNKVSLLEVAKYAKQLKVTVFREQGYKNFTENLFEVEYSGKHYVNGVLTEMATMSTSAKIYMTSYKEAMYVRTSDYSDYVWVTFFNAEDEVVGEVLTIPTAADSVIQGISCKYALMNLGSVDESAVYFRVSLASATVNSFEVHLR